MLVLTPRERQVVGLLALGRTIREVAAALGVSVNTVRTHRANAGAKTDGGALVSILSDLGWLVVPPELHDLDARTCPFPRTSV